MYPGVDLAALASFVERSWDAHVMPELRDYIRIPCKSPDFDPQWQENGHLDAAVELLTGWAKRHLASVPGATVEVVRLSGRTPLIFIDIPGDAGDCVLLYGHLDKQPEMSGWREGLGPWTPVLEGDKLYGRGGADDGYAMYAAILSILALREQGIGHARCVIVIEACEESGSYDLPSYVEHLSERIGEPSLVVCLDSGCGNYDQLWLTTSLRGLLGGTLRVQVLEEGVHSGDASGVVPSSFRILRSLLSRLEDESSGRIIPSTLQVEVPPDRMAESAAAAEALGPEIHRKFPFAGATSPASEDPRALVVARAWLPQMEVIGADGLPAAAEGGNVLRPFTSAKISLRLPPTLDPEAALACVHELLAKDPPYDAQVGFEPTGLIEGWNAPAFQPWLTQALDAASLAVFGRPAVRMGEGGSIPFMRMLGVRFPSAQFVVTGVLGPHSNAHGPNEFLHVPTAKRVTQAVALVLASHAQVPK